MHLEPDRRSSRNALRSERDHESAVNGSLMRVSRLAILAHRPDDDANADAPDLEAGVVATVMRGGDTDTNAAIAGALVGPGIGPKACRRAGVARC